VKTRPDRPSNPPRPNVPDLSTLRKVERLKTVYGLTDAVSRAHGLPEICEAALRGLERALGTNRASVLLLDSAGVMRFRAWHGLSDRYRAAVEGHSPWKNDVTNPEPVLVPDVRSAPELASFGDLFASEGIGALAFIPLVSRERLIGKFMVYFQEPYAFQPEEVDLARTLAGHVAFAVERKQGDEKLALYRQIFDHSSEAIAILDEGGRYREQNAAHRRLIGYEDADLIGQTLALHLDEDEFPIVAKAIERGQAYRNDVTSVTPSGGATQLELSAFPVFGETDRPVCTVVSLHDIHERKRAEGALQFLAGASASLDRSLDYDATLRAVARLSVPVLADWAMVDAIDENGSIHPAVSAYAEPNRAASLAKLVAIRRSETSDEEAWRSLALAVTPDAPSGADLRFGAPSGDAPLTELLGELPASSALAIPLRARGRVLGLLTLVSATRTYEPRDISLAEGLARRAGIALDNARLYREAQESDRRKEEFLAVLAHELRNPLAPLLTCLELMRTPETNTHSLGRWRTIMERQVRNLTRLVDDLLDISRVTRGKIELQKRPVELATVVARAVETTRPLIDSRGLQVSVLVDRSIRLEADPLRIEQVLANLLNNAAKYTPSGGRVEIEAKRDGEDVVVAVRDDGMGIAPDMLPRIFDLFVQGEEAQGGLGIGLMLARTLVELHGGTIRASSPGQGQGSTFVVRLPAGPPERVPDWADSPSPSVAVAHGYRALVVDDNVDGATVLAEALRTRGHEVHIAHDGQSALREALRHAPDVVLLDIGLPDLDGYEVATRIRNEPALTGTRVIAVTGFGQEHQQGRSATAGFDHHMVKPIDLAQLDAVLASWDVERANPEKKPATSGA